MMSFRLGGRSVQIDQFSADSNCKKGNTQKCANYRPLVIISIMYKVFSRMFCERLQKPVRSKLLIVQAAYKKTFSTLDHL